MGSKIYTVSDLAVLVRDYDAAWKSAASEAELPAMPLLEGEFDPRGLENAVEQVADDFDWLVDFFATCQNGRWWKHKTALVEFPLPDDYRRFASQRGEHTLRICHRELGDIHIDVGYEDGCVRLEFIGLL